MIPWRELDRAPVPGGQESVVLRQRGTDFDIRVGPHLLMSSLLHGSEEILAEGVTARLRGRPAPRLLVGGLGMGFTLAAALRGLPPGATLVVAELIPAVVAWNRGPLAHLAGRPLEDTRVTVAEADVLTLYDAPGGPWDAVVLDVDNGPDGLTRAGNSRLYTGMGLAAAHASLRPGGLLGVWSVDPDPEFTRRLKRAGFRVEEEAVRARRTKGGRHTLWLASRSAPGRAECGGGTGRRGG